MVISFINIVEVTLEKERDNQRKMEKNVTKKKKRDQLKKNENI